MSTHYGWKRGDFWSVTPFDQESNPLPYRLGGFMSKRCFNAITRELRFTYTNPSPYVDKFWKIRQTVKAWNYHIASIFLVYWEICSNKYMSTWYSRWTWPGWIFCPHNTHPFGNECQTARCALSGIFFVAELVEGKAHPCQAGPLEFKDLNGKTAGLLLRMMKSYFPTGRYVILDFGFCVLKGLMHLRKKGDFPCAVINKRGYWPSMVEEERHWRRAPLRSVLITWVILWARWR